MRQPLLLDTDRAIWTEELADFVPRRIFDAHVHLYDARFLPADEVAGRPLFQRYAREGLRDMRRHSAALFRREVHFLATGFPTRGCDLPGMDAFVAGEVAQDRESFALMLAHPDLTAKEIEARLDPGAFCGFKPYMCFSRNRNPACATVLQMLPERYWRIAQERELTILLHLGRYRAMADPLNQRQVRDLAERYPRARLQLAHCARCFTPEIAEAGLPSVADLPNVHVDTSAVCESEVFHILLDVWPRERIVFGTDIAPAGLARGKVATFGRGWYHVDEDNTAAFAATHFSCRPTFLAYENLRAIRFAARRKGWGAREREDFFRNNAHRLFKLSSGR